MILLLDGGFCYNCSMLLLTKCLFTTKYNYFAVLRLSSNLSTLNIINKVSFRSILKCDYNFFIFQHILIVIRTSNKYGLFDIKIYHHVDITSITVIKKYGTIIKVVTVLLLFQY